MLHFKIFLIKPHIDLYICRTETYRDLIFLFPNHIGTWWICFQKKSWIKYSERTSRYPNQHFLSYRHANSLLALNSSKSAKLTDFINRYTNICVKIKLSFLLPSTNEWTAQLLLFCGISFSGFHHYRCSCFCKKNLKIKHGNLTLNNPLETLHCCA